MAEDDELSTQYAFLLQPIRDLQKNWDIDISHLLEEFVERWVSFIQCRLFECLWKNPSLTLGNYDIVTINY